MWTSKNRARYDRSKLRYPSDLTDERPWLSYASPQSASCSENSAIRPEVSGRTLNAARSFRS
jgi:hypothetical protein